MKQLPHIGLGVPKEAGSILNVDDFIARWTASGGSERANFQQFTIELTQFLDGLATKPATADAQNDDCRFEARLLRHGGQAGHGCRHGA